MTPYLNKQSGHGILTDENRTLSTQFLYKNGLTLLLRIYFRSAYNKTGYWLNDYLRVVLGFCRHTSDTFFFSGEQGEGQACVLRNTPNSILFLFQV